MVNSFCIVRPRCMANLRQ